VFRPPAYGLLIGSLFTLGSCGGGSSPAGEQPAQEASSVQPAAAAAPATDTAPPVRRFLPDEARRATRAERFPHEAHVGIDCHMCHETPKGHTTHASVGCPQCHRSSAFVTGRVLTKADCLTCHHGGTNGRKCTDCHQAPPGPLVVERTFQLSVWSAPRTRTLPFDHTLHASQACAACHKAMPNLKPTEPCGTCHERHHRPEARCMTCHREPPAGAHTLDAHLNCNGAGCHDEPVTEHMTETRSICLVCHQQQESHESGRICAECHQVRPGAPAQPASREAPADAPIPSGSGGRP
jgi:hypothetical protein